jgi:hypothetical protein
VPDCTVYRQLFLLLLLLLLIEKDDYQGEAHQSHSFAWIRFLLLEMSGI